MAEPSDNLYITNLPAELDETMVKEFFSIYGIVTSVKVLKNPIAMGKTAALVRFASVEEATSIMQTLNGTVPTGLEEPVQVKYAAKKEASAWPAAAKGIGKAWDGGMAGYGAANGLKGGYGKWDGGWNTGPYAGPHAGSYGGQREPEISDNIYVQGLPAGTTEESLRQTFMEFGNIKSLKLLPQTKPDSPCAALIRYDSTETAKLTKEILHGQTPEGFPGPLVVKYANQPGQAQDQSAWAGAAGGGAWAAACGKGAWGQAAQSWNANASWGASGKGKGQVEGVLSTVELVDMVYASNMLPGGTKYFNDKASLYVAGLPWDATDVHLYKMFSPYGAIHTCTTKSQGMQGTSNWSIGFVNYLDPVSAEAAITAYNGMSLPDGNSLKVSIKSSKA